MTDLTEQWKKGELPNGWYWVKGIKSEGIYAYTAEYLNNMYRPRNSEKIIEQVPSYQEYKRLKEVERKKGKLVNVNYKIKQENQQLKELLKEWAQFETEENPNDFTVISERMSELADKTKQAIGEKK